MSAVQIQGNAGGTGTLTVAAPSTNTNRTLTLPDGTGTFSVAGVNSNIVAGTAQTAPPTTPQYFDFTGIPTWVKRITVLFSGVSTSGTSIPQIQIGAGSITTTGYSTSTTQFVDAGTVSAAVAVSGFTCLTSNAAVYNLIGSIQICNISSNIWVASGVLGMSTTARSSLVTGNISLSGALDRVRVTTVNGTDTFDAGAINILYE
jgi:hypothetical protein